MLCAAAASDELLATIAELVIVVAVTGSPTASYPARSTILHCPCTPLVGQPSCYRPANTHPRLESRSQQPGLDKVYFGVPIRLHTEPPGSQFPGALALHLRSSLLMMSLQPVRAGLRAKPRVATPATEIARGASHCSHSLSASTPKPGGFPITTRQRLNVQNSSQRQTCVSERM